MVRTNPVTGWKSVSIIHFSPPSLHHICLPAPPPFLFPSSSPLNSITRQEPPTYLSIYQRITNNNERQVFAVGHHVQKIHGLTDEESRGFLDWFVRLVVENHDLQVRHRWQSPNDLAIWDNRSVYHAATPDYLFDGLGERTGSRAVSLGEKPYFDPRSTSRREALAAAAIAAAGAEGSS